MPGALVYPGGIKETSLSPGLVAIGSAQVVGWSTIHDDLEATAASAAGSQALVLQATFLGG